jgi:hypothetical protein
MLPSSPLPAPPARGALDARASSVLRHAQLRTAAAHISDAGRNEQGAGIDGDDDSTGAWVDVTNMPANVLVIA